MILGGHGITAWGDTSDECEARSLEIIATAQKFIDERGKPDPFGETVTVPLPAAERRARAAALAPYIRGLASTDKPQLGHYSDHPAVLDFVGSEKLAAAGGPGHVLPGPLPAHQGPPHGPRPAAGRAARRRDRPAARAARRLPGGLPGLLRALRDRGLAADARRRPGDRPRPRRRHVQLRRGQADGAGRGRVLPQRDQRDARRGGDLDLRRRSRRARSSASSTGNWRRPSSAAAPGRSPWRAGSPWSPAAARASAGPPRQRLAAEGACVVVADRDAGAAATVAAELGAGGIVAGDVAVPVTADVTSEADVAAAVRRGRSRLRRRRPGGEQRRACRSPSR